MKGVLGTPWNTQLENTLQMYNCIPLPHTPSSCSEGWMGGDRKAPGSGGQGVREEEHTFQASLDDFGDPCLKIVMANKRQMLLRGRAFVKHLQGPAFSP